MSDLLSVIVPIYNSEKYLSRCINSLLMQTYSNLEIILVNDGSQDRSKIICEEYQRRHKNIVLLNKTNGGLGAARNFGLDHCHGDYVGFVDSDDWIDPDYYSALLTACKDYECEIASFDVDITTQKKLTAEKCRNYKFKIIDNNLVATEFARRSYRDSNYYSVCTCLFHKKIIGIDRFVEGKINEDMDFKFALMLKCNRWAISLDKKYHYFQSGKSLSSGLVKKKDLDLFQQTDRVYKIAKQTNDAELIYYAELGKYKANFSILARIVLCGCDDQILENEIEMKCLAELRTHYKKLILSPIKISRKLLIIALCKSYKMTKAILRRTRGVSENAK